MSTQEFFLHYIEYLTSSAVLLTLLLVAPILYNVFKGSGSSPTRYTSSPFPGCRRLGLPKGHSNLVDQFKTVDSSPAAGDARVKSLFTYPIKSTRGVELSGSEVIGTGLKYDRLFAFAIPNSKQVSSNDAGEAGKQPQSTWLFRTQREVPRLALLETELWVPDPRTTVTVAGPSRRISEDGDHEGGARSRGRKSTLVLESGGLPSTKRRKLSVPELEENWLANGGCLVVRFPWKPDFNPFGLRTETVTMRIPLDPTPQRAECKGYTHENLSIWKDCPLAINVTNEIHQLALQKLRDFLGVKKPLALFRINDSHQRTVTRNLPEEMADGRFKVGFADGFPVNLLNIVSVRALDADLPATAEAKGNLDARRFRANIYIEGPPAYAEDDWKRVVIGHSIEPYSDDDGWYVEGVAEYHVACRATRCKLPNVHPDTGVKDRNEPDATLRRVRLAGEGAKSKAVLGMHMVPLFEHGVIRVGDVVEVVDTEEHLHANVPLSR